MFEIVPVNKEHVFYMKKKTQRQQKVRISSTRDLHKHEGKDDTHTHKW